MFYIIYIFQWHYFLLEIITIFFVKFYEYILVYLILKKKKKKKKKKKNRNRLFFTN